MIVYLSLISGDGASLINWVSDNIDNSAKGLSSYRDHDGGSSVKHLLASDKTLSTVHSNGPIINIQTINKGRAKNIAIISSLDLVIESKICVQQWIAIGWLVD